MIQLSLAKLLGHQHHRTCIVPEIPCLLSGLYFLESSRKAHSASLQGTSESEHCTVGSEGTKGTPLRRNHPGTWMLPVPRILQRYLMMQHIFSDRCFAVHYVHNCYLSPLWDSHQPTAEIASTNISA